MTPANALLIMWLTFTACAVLGVCGILVWAVRSRQFSRQNRARYLPLLSGIPSAGGHREVPLRSPPNDRHESHFQPLNPDLPRRRFLAKAEPRTLNPASDSPHPSPAYPPGGDHVSS